MTEKLCGNCPYNPVEQMIRGGDEPCPDAFKEQAKYCNYNYNCQKHGRRLIDAEALIEALLETRREETETTLKLVRFIRKQPTVEQKAEGLSVFEESVQADRAVCVYVPIEPKRGRWKREVLGSTSGYGTTIMYRCSLCERMSISEYNYCPNCGAKKEGQDETD